MGISLLHALLGLAAAPFLLGVINRTKAMFAGRQGQPVLQLYFDIARQLRKGAVFSTTTSWVFRAGPTIGLACCLSAMTLVPFGGAPGLLSFGGDMLLLVYILGLARFFTVIAALDTGSSFEGMGASREVLFSALSEPALLIGLVALARVAGSLSLARMLPAAVWNAPELVLVGAVFCVVLLCENSRIPFDDPATHLELTMIHEVMVLDHSGPDFAYILYGSALKFWILGSVVTGMMVPPLHAPWWLGTIAGIAGMLVLAVGVGVVESIMARLRLARVPQLLVAANAVAVISLVLVVR